MTAAEVDLTSIGAEEDKADTEKASQLPVPTGYHILIGLPEIEEKTEGGIIKARTTLEIEETASMVGFVIAMGPDCYKDEKRFPNGPWCKEGDFILMRAYSGTRIKIHGKEFRLINDDTPEAVVDDPRGISRV
jgi:co-chaperonin GroES (HSP10)|tara:strand:+ start:1414 stop:1812 length:399 start_codon:yes stop_codon:yes gene_type:complete